MAGQITVTPEGIQVPQASEIKEAFQGVFVASLGADLSLDDSTPQGDLINGLTEEKQLDNAQTLYFLNQLNPKTNSGIFQDAIGSIFGIERRPATYSTVNCECIGLPGTVLNGVSSGNPAMAQSISGDVFQCLIGGTIPASGTITLQFGAIEPGAIPVSENTITTIYSVVGGWDSVNNSTAGTVGLEQESRVEFENRRQKTLAINATGSLDAIRSHILEVDGVTDVFCYENFTNSSVTYKGITLTAHSVFVCQNGARSSSDLAYAFYQSLSAGCDTNTDSLNPLTCTYTDPLNGISYTYKYYNSTNTPIYIQINLAFAISDSLKQQIKEALFKEFNGNSIIENEKITIGSDVYASRFYNVINKLANNEIILKNIKVSTDGTNWYDVLTFNMNILPVLDIESTSPSYVIFNVV